MEKDRGRIQNFLPKDGEAKEGVRRVVGKKSNVVQSGRIIRTSKGDLNISIFDGCDAKTVIAYAAFVKCYEKHGDYTLTTAGGKVLNDDEPIGTCQEFFFKDLKVKNA